MQCNAQLRSNVHSSCRRGPALDSCTLRMTVSGSEREADTKALLLAADLPHTLVPRPGSLPAVRTGC